MSNIVKFNDVRHPMKFPQGEITLEEKNELVKNFDRFKN